MNHLEIPAIASSAYASNTVSLAGLALAQQQWLKQVSSGSNAQTLAAPAAIPAVKEKTMSVTRRLVQVFIADPNEHVPLEQSLLYRGEQKLTDLTDQELFFEIDIKSLLDKHNEARIKLVNKAVKERTEHLEPARIRDLKMVVVSVAAF